MAVTSPKRRGSLCGRCGAILPELEIPPGGSAEGECPECGLGFGRKMLTRADVIASEPMATYKPFVIEKWRRTVEEAAFPLYGLDGTWTGSRWIGGSGSRNGVVDQIELGHGDWREESVPAVRVTTHQVVESMEKFMALHAGAEMLAHEMWQQGLDHESVRRTYASSDPTEGWDEVTITSGGKPVVFRTMSAPPWWVGLGEVGDAVVALRARNLSPEEIRLEVVEDVERYLEEELP